MEWDAEVCGGGKDGSPEAFVTRRVPMRGGRRPGSQFACARTRQVFVARGICHLARSHARVKMPGQPVRVCTHATNSKFLICHLRYLSPGAFPCARADARAASRVCTHARARGLRVRRSGCRLRANMLFCESANPSIINLRSCNIAIRPYIYLSKCQLSLCRVVKMSIMNMPSCQFTNMSKRTSQIAIRKSQYVNLSFRILSIRERAIL